MGTKGKKLNNNHSTSGGKRSRFVLPILYELHAYRGSTLRADAISGATVALVSIPQTIGFALIVGVPPQVVVYAAIVGVLFTALFSSSRHLVAGPTTSISIILASTIHAIGTDRMGAVEIVAALALIIGMIQLIAGLVNLGTLNRFISRSVIVGYTAAVALLIGAGQISNLVGIDAPLRTDFFSIAQNIVVNVWHADVHLFSALVGCGTLIFLGIMNRWFSRWPAGLIALILTGALVAAFDLSDFGVRIVRDIGSLEPVLPSFSGAPVSNLFTLGMFGDLMGPAIAIAILGMLETVSLSKAVATSSGQRVNPNQEMVGLGIGNIMAGFFGTMPGSASFVRTATNYQTGGRTQMAAVFSALSVALVILLFARFADYIPIASLAAMLIFICARMVNHEQIMIAISSTGSDLAVFLATFLATLFLSLDTAIFVGVGTSLVLFLRKAASPHLVEYAFNESGSLAQIDEASQRQNDQISIIHVEGELFFGAAEIFQEEIRRIADDEGIRVFILRLKNARHVDATSIVSLMQLLDYLKRTDRHLLVSGITDEIEQVFRNSGFMKKIGKENVFRAEANPTMSTKRALLRASHLLQSSTPDIRIFYDRDRSKGEGGESGREDSGPVDFQI